MGSKLSLFFNCLYSFNAESTKKNSGVTEKLFADERGKCIRVLNSDPLPSKSQGALKVSQTQTKIEKDIQSESFLPKSSESALLGQALI